MSQYQNKIQDKRIDNLEEQISQVQEHISTTNSVMGSIKTDIEWLKKSVQQVNDRTWWILGTIIIGFVIQLVLKLY